MTPERMNDSKMTTVTMKEWMTETAPRKKWTTYMKEWMALSGLTYKASMLERMDSYNCSRETDILL